MLSNEFYIGPGSKLYDKQSYLSYMFYANIYSVMFVWSIASYQLRRTLFVFYQEDFHINIAGICLCLNKTN